MIRVVAFRYYPHIDDRHPEGQLQKFLKDHSIDRDQIISVTSGGREGVETLFLCYEDTKKSNISGGHAGCGSSVILTISTTDA